jgi:hypothetical protein
LGEQHYTGYKPFLVTTKVPQKSPAVGSFYETEFEILAGMGRLGSLDFMNFFYFL